MALQRTRLLGRGGPEVSAIGFGTMGLSMTYGDVGSDEQRLQVLDHVHKLGCRFWDTADVYGDSEDLIGKWFQRSGKRNDIFVATKFGGTVNTAGEYVVRSDPEYVRQACLESLRRLGISQIDLYYCHRVDLKTPIEKTVQAMAKLKAEGKISHLGLCEVSAATLRRAHAVHPISAIQVEYSPFSLDIEDPKISLRQTARELGVTVVAYSPLGRGMLTGRYKSAADFEDGDFRRSLPRFSEENFAKNLVLVSKVQDIARRKGCTAGQVTLAWLLAQGQDVIPIPGSKTIRYVEENLGALNVELDIHDMDEMRTAINSAVVTGDRYPDSMVGNLLADTPSL